MELWLYELGLPRKEYVESDDAVTCQDISQRNHIHSYLITDGQYIPILPRKRPIATQNNRSTDEEQHPTAIYSFGLPVNHAKITPPVTTTYNLQQQTMFAVW